MQMSKQSMILFSSPLLSISLCWSCTRPVLRSSRNLLEGSVPWRTPWGPESWMRECSVPWRKPSGRLEIGDACCSRLGTASGTAWRPEKGVVYFTVCWFFSLPLKQQWGNVSMEMDANLLPQVQCQRCSNKATNGDSGVWTSAWNFLTD